MAVADSRGWLFYYGRPCTHGHIGKRYIKNKQCVHCSVEAGRKKNKAQYEKHKEKRKAYARQYRQENWESICKQQVEYLRKKRRTDPAAAMKIRMQSRIRDSLFAVGAKKNSTTEQMLGCSIGEFIRHIELQFLPGMSWDNRSEWHIDHIVPCATAKSVEELESLFHFTNLRPLWAADNLVKSDKVYFLL